MEGDVRWYRMGKEMEGKEERVEWSKGILGGKIGFHAILSH